MRKKAYMLGREMIWSHVAHMYMESFSGAAEPAGHAVQAPGGPHAGGAADRSSGWRLDHLVRMTDSAGLLQHANSTIPNFAEGYCTDDNARACS